MVPIDCNSIIDEYHILVNELKSYNPELLDKERILAITKSDLADKELIDEIEKDLPDIPYVFISSFTKKGLNRMKNLIWNKLTET